MEEFIPNPHSEAIIAPFNVNFVARCGGFKEELNGNIEVLQNALNLDYLWDRVRVHGGAYGCSSRIEASGTIGFTSYRDPNIDSTDLAYKEIVNYINNINFNDEELLKYKIGALGNIYNSTLEEILSSNKYQNIINNFNNRKAYLDICKHCSYKERF